MVDLFICIFGIFFWPKCFFFCLLCFWSIFLKCFPGSTGVLVRRAVTARNWSTFLWSRPTQTTPFYMITKLYKEYPCIFVIQFMLDNVEAFFAGDQPQQHCVTPFFWEIQLLCICLELFIGLEFSCRPISASFLIRTSGKEYHSQAGSTSLMKKLACPGYEVHLSKGHFHTLIIRPVSCLVSWHLPSSPNDGV